MSKFKVGDSVIHCKGNVPRQGTIKYIDDILAPHGFQPLAFYGEDHYFEWLHIAEPYLTHATNTSAEDNSQG